MDNRAAKLALARKKLKDHQDKKHVVATKSEINNITEPTSTKKDESEITVIEYPEHEHDKNVNDNNLETVQNNMQHTSNTIFSEPNIMDVNVTEILISNKRNLEVQVSELQSKLAELDTNLRMEIMGHNDSKYELKNLQNEFHALNDKYQKALYQIHQQNQKVEEFNVKSSSLVDINNNLLEQLEFTKTVLTAKETENASLYSQLNQLQSELEVAKLQIQQLINGSNAYTYYKEEAGPSQSELLQKVEILEQQLKVLQKEKEQINIHCEHYIAELNEQLRSSSLRNEELSKQVLNLSERENNLIDQMTDMEIRIQNLQAINKEIENKPLINSKELNDLQNEHHSILEQLRDITEKYKELEKLYQDSEEKNSELKDRLKQSCVHDNISISKLTADIASDKIAAQRATEQNKKLKVSIQELEEAFVKMSQDKLELTEKVTAEKFLNRELTIKLAEIEENCKDLHVKLKAKDDEMIRLQAGYRNLESEFMKLANTASTVSDNIVEVEDTKTTNTTEHLVLSGDTSDMTHNCNHEHDCPKSIFNLDLHDNTKIPKEDAMVKLQERFLKIMDEVADLSDEKHRLEHIILQLQNETDTICEYVALYQQQRSLLKKRDEERATQIKFFQTECDRLKRQIEELSGILIRFAEDAELSSYFQVETRQKDMEKVRNLLLDLKNNTLIDPKRNHLELTKIYPCNCCSGNLIDV